MDDLSFRWMQKKMDNVIHITGKDRKRIHRVLERDCQFLMDQGLQKYRFVLIVEDLQKEKKQRNPLLETQKSIKKAINNDSAISSSIMGEDSSFDGCKSQLFEHLRGKNKNKSTYSTFQDTFIESLQQEDPFNDDSLQFNQTMFDFIDCEKRQTG